ncbi:hypothetical protein [Anoxybacteroides tepidamans]|uniref:hypothetical protein n=1 Tax=Anoxybacteroides tepidamans TaxID=265948 RepID=UPI000488EB6B|nr:hypothetical protein [Anoxybacillus tepidamans]
MDANKEQPKKWPNTAAFQDEYTRKFMASTKEVKDGYYLFKSKTGGYTMWFPKNATMSKLFYEKHEKYFESLRFGESDKVNNIAYSTQIVYENKKITDSIGVNLELLSESTNYKGEFKKLYGKDMTVYFAKQEYLLSDKKSKVHRFIGYLKSNHSHQAVEFYYAVSCLDKKEVCRIDLEKEEKKAKMLMQSVRFLN